MSRRLRRIFRRPGNEQGGFWHGDGHRTVAHRLSRRSGATVGRPQIASSNVRVGGRRRSVAFQENLLIINAAQSGAQWKME
jgi:hypothetical protein